MTPMELIALDEHILSFYSIDWITADPSAISVNREQY